MFLWYLAAALWGGAEAIVFFFVADILLTFAVIRLGAKAAVKLAVVAALAAVAGGAALYGYATGDLEAVRSLILSVPAIGPDQVAHVQAGMDRWVGNLFLAAFSGVPYKIFAVEAAGAGIGLLAFAVVSIPARLLRFLIVIGLASALARFLSARWGMEERSLHWLTGAFWIVFYAGYFSLRATAS